MPFAVQFRLPFFRSRPPRPLPAPQMERRKVKETQCSSFTPRHKFACLPASGGG